METGTPKPFPTETCWARLADASFSLRPLTRSAAHSTCRRHSQPTPQLPPALDAVAAPRQRRAAAGAVPASDAARRVAPLRVLAHGHGGRCRPRPLGRTFPLLKHIMLLPTNAVSVLRASPPWVNSCLTAEGLSPGPWPPPVAPTCSRAGSAGCPARLSPSLPRAWRPSETWSATTCSLRARARSQGRPEACTPPSTAPALSAGEPGPRCAPCERGTERATWPPLRRTAASWPSCPSAEPLLPPGALRAGSQGRTLWARPPHEVLGPRPLLSTSHGDSPDFQTQSTHTVTSRHGQQPEVSPATPCSPPSQGPGPVMWPTECALVIGLGRPAPPWVPARPPPQCQFLTLQCAGSPSGGAWCVKEKPQHRPAPWSLEPPPLA